MRIWAFVRACAIDVLVAAVLVVALLEVWLEDGIHGSPWALTLFALAWGLPLFARRRFPVAAPGATVILVAVQAAIWEHTVPYSLGAFLMVLIAVSQFGLLGPTIPGLAGAALTALAIVVVIVRDPNGSTGDLVFVTAIAAVAWMSGFAMYERNRRTVELTERAERAERARETEARAAAAEERARIAREMHDVVAHSLSVMVVQAEAAEAMLDSDPERARRPLAAVQETGRTALTELRRMLGVLREMADEGPALAPQPGLSGLDDLARQVRDAGLPVIVRVEGEPRPLSPGLDLSAYRIVQEGLTNALKHAGPATAEVVVRYGPRDLELEVRDDGRGRGSGANGGGHGLTGMRERVALFGGDLRAGPRPGGGFALTARLPLEVLELPVTIRVLIADDQALVRDGFGMILDAQDDIEVVAEAEDGAQAVELARALRPDVVLMDIRMPEVDGIEATRRLLADGDGPRVLMLTTFDQNEYVYEAMKSGASGFLLKDVRREELVNAVRVVAAGDAMLAPTLTRRLIEDFVRRPPPGAGAAEAVAELTDRESEVLRLVARGLSNAEIAAELVVSEATVKTHIARILSKLGLRDRIQAVVLAYESGFVQPGEG